MALLYVFEQLYELKFLQQYQSSEYILHMSQALCTSVNLTDSILSRIFSFFKTKKP